MIIVTNNNNAGAGSLRQALLDAALGEEITFSITGTIVLNAELDILQDVIITGPGTGSLSISGQNLGRVFHNNSGADSTITGLSIIDGAGIDGGGIYNDATLTLDNVIINNCSVTGSGGGIYNAGTIEGTSVTVSNCSCDVIGGGIYNANGATITLENSEVSSNNSDNDGGGVYNDTGTVGDFGDPWVNVLLTNNTSGASGAAVYSITGTLRFVECTFASNSGGGAGLALFSVECTAAFVRCAITNHAGNAITASGLGSMLIDNSTISTNTSGLESVGPVGNAINNCTITLNSVGVIIDASGGIDFYNTILSGNTVDYSGPTASAISNGHNIFGVNTNPITPAAGDQSVLTFAELLLGALQNNGGPTETHALLVGSPAIDAGNNASAPDTDQRGTGFPRVLNGTIDIGAYEGTSDEPPPDPDPEPPNPDPDPPSPTPTPDVPTSSSVSPCPIPPEDCGYLGVRADDAFPGIANLSAETPDRNIAMGIRRPTPWKLPPVTGGKVGPRIIIYGGPDPCTAQAPATDGTGAAAMSGQVSEECDEDQEPNPDGDDYNYPDWPQPPDLPGEPGVGVLLFPNDAATGIAFCSDGSPFTYTVPEKTYWELSRSLANQKAQSYANKTSQNRVMCISGTFGAACANATFTTVVTMNGANVRPNGLPRFITWTVVAGTLPTGLLLTSSTSSMNLGVSGIPTTPGNYSFTLRGMDQDGYYMQKAFTMAIIGIVTELPDPAMGVDYSQQLLTEGGSGDEVYTLLAGTIPTGLTLSEGGLISGTPTEETIFSFVVGVTKNGKTCTKQYILQVTGSDSECTEMLANIPFASVSVQAAYDPVNQVVFVGNFNNATVDKVDPLTDTIVATTAALGGSVVGVVWVPGPTIVGPGPAILATVANGSIYHIDPLTMVDTVIKVLSGDTAAPMAYASATDKLFISVFTGSPGFDIYDIATDTITNISGTGGAGPMVYNPDLGEVYCTNYDTTSFPGANLLALNQTTGAVTKQIAFSTAGESIFGTGLTYCPTSASIYVGTHKSSDNTNSLYVVDATAFTETTKIVLPTWPVFNGPSTNYDPVHEVIMVGVVGNAFADNTIHMFDPLTNLEICQIAELRTNSKGASAAVNGGFYVQIISATINLDIAHFGVP